MNLLLKGFLLIVIYYLHVIFANDHNIISSKISVKKLGPCTAELDDGSIIDLSKCHSFLIQFITIECKIIILKNIGTLDDPKNPR